MSPEVNKAVVLRYVDGLNAGDFDAVAELFAQDAVVYGVLGQGSLQVAKPVWEALHSGLGMRLHVEEMVAEGDTVAVRYTEKGTFRGPFRGHEPTGRSYQVTAMEWFQLVDGRITQRWGARDSAAIAAQIGLPSL